MNAAPYTLVRRWLVADSPLSALDDRLHAVLEDVKLAYLLEREGGWGAAANWEDMLSLGEQQRLGMVSHPHCQRRTGAGASMRLPAYGEDGVLVVIGAVFLVKIRRSSCFVAFRTRLEAKSGRRPNAGLVVSQISQQLMMCACVWQARLFFHRPKFGVLDECTNATSVEVEEYLYRTAQALGITVITISQVRASPFRLCGATGVVEAASLPAALPARTTRASCAFSLCLQRRRGLSRYLTLHMRRDYSLWPFACSGRV